MAEFERIGKYQIVGEIGEGAMGVVYKAHDPVLNRFVAIKMISGALKADDDLRERFQREAQAAASLNHANIITIHDFGEDHGRIYMAMELLVGTDLKELIGSPTLRRLEDKVGVMEQICDGLAFAHEREVVHRDLKPGNIHIQPNGVVKLLDFGLARLGSSDMTKTGLVMGTPNYMSPEQVMGERVDGRSDVFSVGAVFYELLTNRKPFEADSVHGVMFRVVHKEPPPVRQWVPTMPPIMVQLIEKCLAKDKNERFQNGAELRAALTQVRQALTGGRINDATLIIASGLEIADEPLDAFDEPGAAPERRQRVHGTLALDSAAEISAADETPPPRPRTRPPLSDTGRGALHVQETGSLRPHRRSGAIGPAAYVGGGLVVAALVGGTVWLATRKTESAAAVTPGPSQDQLGALTAALVATQVQLARRDLEDKEYARAAAEAERVLKLAPNDPDARQILDSARSVQREVEKAAGVARAAVDAGDTARASEALAQILSLDPKHPSATELSERLNQFFKTRAEQAKAAMVAARAEAEKASGQSAPAFQQGTSVAREAQTLLARGQFAMATRGFLESRDAFDKARRAAVQPPAAAPRTAANPPPLLPPPTVPALTPPLPTPAPTAAPPTPDPGPQRALAPGRTTVLGQQAKGGMAGFDTGGIEVRQDPSDIAGALTFEVTPPSPRGGERFTIRVVLQNEGKKGVKVKAIRASATVNGARTAIPGRLADTDVKPKERSVVAEIAGTWPDQSSSWALDVTVAADRGEFKSQLSWR